MQLITTFFTDLTFQAIVSPMWLVFVYFIVANQKNINKPLLNTLLFLAGFIISYTALFIKYDGYNGSTNFSHFLFFLYIWPFFSIISSLAWMLPGFKKNRKQYLSLLGAAIIIEALGFAFLMSGLAEKITILFYGEM